MFALIGAATGCKLDSLHDDAWEAKDEFELTFCGCRAETDEMFDVCLYGYRWLHAPDTKAFRRECEADLDDERKHRGAARAYYECVIERHEPGLGSGAWRRIRAV